ncbi:MAG: tRNA pseudouridine(55) synthase TruB, partial [Pseudomonadales bacterium]|nr:tRNA pseudouridine(55) synthase TruB [Pseudomonadales bacterium]
LEVSALKAAKTNELVRVYAPGQVFLGIGEILDDGRVAPKRLISAFSAVENAAEEFSPSTANMRG